MIEYRITHTTNYHYGDPVRVCHNLVLLTPRETEQIHCVSHRLTIKPTPQISSRRKDFFGNLVHSFSIEESHKQLSVTATSRVTVSPRALPQPAATMPWESVAARLATRDDPNWLDAAPFLFDSRRIRRSEDFLKFAKGVFTPGRPILEAADALTRRIHGEFRYDATATDVDTPPESAFRIRKGVCQDFAQIAIGCLRSIGIPARYVSGYLRTVPPPGRPRLVGADQSHAWIAVYAGEVGWVEFDPTNACLCTTDHVPVAWGRDYHDVVPMRGVYLGGGQHTLSVSVDVAPQDEAASAEPTVE